jgi:transcriptional regulator with XRE-family HTH domain
MKIKGSTGGIVELIDVVDTDWFKAKLEDQCLSLRDLAKLMHLEPSAVSLMLRGRRGISAGEVVQLARHLQAPTEEVLYRAGLNLAGVPKERRLGNWETRHRERRASASE